MEMDNNKCGCWSVLKRGVCKPSTSRHSPNTIPRTSVVHDAGFFLLLSFMVFLFLLNIMDEYNAKKCFTCLFLYEAHTLFGLGVFWCLTPAHMIELCHVF